MLPDRITIKKAAIVDGEPKEVSKEYYYKFNYNAGTSFRKAKGLKLSEMQSLFAAFESGNLDDQSEAVHAFGELFYYALIEGHRMLGLTCDLSIEDALNFLNEDPANISVVGQSYADANDSGDKKKAEQATQ